MENFNGIISLLIACIEFLLFINLLIFVEKNKVNIVALMMIFVLASYQTVEFLMCNLGLQTSFFPYLAFVIITLLPPLNLLLAFFYTNNNLLSKYKYLLFIPAVSFIVYYTFVISHFEVTKCTVLYATYNYPLGDLYGVFYYLPILASIILLAVYLKKELNKKKKLIGIVLFSGAIFISLVPLFGFILMFAGSYAIISSVESIMCKFAFVYALCLSFVCLYNSPFRDDRNYFKYLSGYK